MTSVLVGVRSEVHMPTAEKQLYAMLDTQARVPLETSAYVNLSECDSSSDRHLRFGGAQHVLNRRQDQSIATNEDAR